MKYEEDKVPSNLNSAILFRCKTAAITLRLVRVAARCTYRTATVSKVCSFPRVTTSLTIQVYNRAKPFNLIAARIMILLLGIKILTLYLHIASAVLFEFSLARIINRKEIPNILRIFAVSQAINGNYTLISSPLRIKLGL